MPIHDIYSKREERLRKGSPDIYTYEELPTKLRVQIVHILNDVIGRDKEGSRYWAEDAFKCIHDILKREYGVFYISSAQDANDRGHVLTAILKDLDVNKVLSIVEESLRYVEEYIVPTYEDDYLHLRYRNNVDYNLSLSEAIEDLNGRFKESAIGYQYEGSNIIRIDSTYIHSEIVLPAINLLNNQIFVGANSEYLAAHKHYREGRNKECLNECLKSVESTIKTICKAKDWPYDDGDTLKRLINVCFEKELIPTSMQNQFTSLKSLLESGIATIRNKTSAHGQGHTIVNASDELTRYGLNLTGSNILFLIESSELF